MRKIVKKESPKGKLDEWEIKAIYEVSKIRNEFYDAMDNDFNTPEAWAAVREALRLGNKAIEEGSWEVSLAVLEFVNEADKVFEVFEERVHEGVEPFIDLLVEVRSKLREMKQWELADYIRSKLDELGVKLLDKGKETEWRFA